MLLGVVKLSDVANCCIAEETSKVSRETAATCMQFCLCSNVQVYSYYCYYSQQQPFEAGEELIQLKRRRQDRYLYRCTACLAHKSKDARGNVAFCYAFYGERAVSELPPTRNGW